MKKCSKCKKHLPKTAFSKDRRSKSGLFAYCKECQKKYHKSYYASNAEKVISRRRTRRAESPENAQISAANYRARKKKAKGTLTVGGWRDKCAFYGYKCYLCKKTLTPSTATIDHRKTMSKGGLNLISNVAPCCRNCNSQKSHFSEAEARLKINAKSNGAAN